MSALPKDQHSAKKSTNGGSFKRFALITGGVAACLVLVSGCSTSMPMPTPLASTPTSSPDPLASWTLEHKVGQVFMVGVQLKNPTQVTVDAVSKLGVGNIFLAERSEAGVESVRHLVDSYTALVTDASTHNTPLFVSTDQEGGEVQVLHGPGFSNIPSAMDQAQETPAGLQGSATRWGKELSSAGVNLNLAPVMGVVPDAKAAENNPPIGQFHRNYGYTVDSVTSHANAFSAGMESSGVDVAIKHFPGLGYVTGNTDTTAGVKDTVITPDYPSLQTFRSGIEAGAAFVMMSTAIYEHLDPARPAAFSPVVIDLLRTNLGFNGVIITDDLSGATQVEQWTPGERAVMAIDAGVDMVLASKTPETINAMVDAVLARAKTDTAFASKIDASVRKVLSAKQRLR